MNSNQLLMQDCQETSSPTSLSALDLFKQQTYLEWTDKSSVNPTLFKQTVQCVPDTLMDPYTHEVSYPIHEALNWKLTRFGFQARKTEFATLILNDDGAVSQKLVADHSLL